ncbi:VTT domain-containing protein [Alteromonas gilva]|uniref:VTT domain-containing protein n=1 Tax=Alteromonas gilva TaxID=2987522 RepID=A0ABT5L1N8_9ALTE|nr:VTT domain-containing protein [Alteromonas gilva]MDC8830956.1 VTT domain-containing protein [Alteromonas gilva]
MTSKTIFDTKTNCWQETHANFATPLIDCANYYRALHSSICKAEKEIIIIGWDIDSRIRLLHGEDEEQSEAPSRIGELIKWKAEQNPDLKIYLLRWDSSFAFFDQREMWALEVWQDKTPDNVKALLDDSIPMGGSQHQKVVLIDNEVLFSGGMDVALHRWDTRDHKIEESERDGPDGEYGPLHDVQIVSCGPLVNHFAELARWRWDRIAQAPMPTAETTESDNELPATWPEGVEPCFTNVDCAIARTIPEMEDVEPVQEVCHMLLDVIGSAEEFIYIENQFATREEIAKALNKRLKECPKLNVMIVSSYDPKGLFESEAYWASRIAFKDIIEDGIDDGRAMMTYSSIRDRQGKMAYKRIHSKVMAVDDKYLIIGSANLSNRSMSLDTEVDLILHGNNEENRDCIRLIRNDLLAEHSGRTVEDVATLIDSDTPVQALMDGQLAHGYVLTEIDDNEFTDPSQENVFRSISDPEKPLGPPIPSLNGKLTWITNPRRRTIMIALGLTILSVLVGILLYISNTVSWLDGDQITAFLEESRGTYFALPTVLLVYLVGGLLFFPVTVLSLAVAAIFGPIWGPVYGMLGALLSAGVTFVIGKLLGNAGLRKLGGPKVEAVDAKLKESGIVGVATIRMLPIAPFSLVNLVAGISSITLVQFLIGTFFGMFPQMIAKGLVGDSIMQIFKSPSKETVTYLVIGLAFWVAMIFGSQKLAKLYQAKKQQKKKDESEECIA